MIFSVYMIYVNKNELERLERLFKRLDMCFACRRPGFDPATRGSMSTVGSDL